MTEKNQNLIYKWTLRAQYIGIFLAGAGVTSFGFDTLLDPGKLSHKNELNIFMALVSILFGVVILIIGFYRKNEIEHYIQHHKL